jgi:glucose-1-phosphate adenylyltransferase
VGTIDAYVEAHQDVLGEQPRFDAFNPQWPIFSSNYQGPVARVLGGTLENTLLGAATLVHKNTVLRNSIVRREAVIMDGAELENCIIMDYVKIGKGARLRNVIVDRHNVIEGGAVIGYDSRQDEKTYHVTPAGVVVIPRGNVKSYARDSRGKGPGYAE